MLRILATEDETMDHSPLPDTEGNRETLVGLSSNGSGKVMKEREKEVTLGRKTHP